jgi:hypothetical protein
MSGKPAENKALITQSLISMEPLAESHMATVTGKILGSQL